MTEDEKNANAAIQSALLALAKACELSDIADYGHQVTTTLADAQRNVNFALDTALGRG